MFGQFISWIKKHKILLGIFVACLILCLPQNVYTLIIYFKQDFEEVETGANFSCFNGHDILKDNLKFGIRGVFVTVVGSLGIISNLFSILVLKRLAAKSGFNKLLLSLGKYVKIYNFS